ncbi:(2Fe-2S)-binding protein [Streptomyces odonnellii]|uniref:(2Fe-2S)-binding protein n=1 Tax=Streptomyces odonnellii TaxID=1417980 RepID=UPI00099DBEF0|nr:(2Fe-2S)-binding protein [Streptomyces odonnellii]
MQVTMTVNGDEVTREIEGHLLLVHFLRDHLALTGTHWGCDTSNCGTCVVWMDGEPVKSCTVLAAMAGGHDIRTVEGLEREGRLDPVQQGFMECHGLQCGFCTPGMMMTARALLDRNKEPSEQEIREALSGQICRCTGYTTIVRSIQWAAAEEAGTRTARGAESFGHRQIRRGGLDRAEADDRGEGPELSRRHICLPARP